MSRIIKLKNRNKESSEDRSKEVFDHLWIIVNAIMRKGVKDKSIVLFAGGRRYSFHASQLSNFVKLYGSVEYAFDALVGEGLILDAYRQRGQVGLAVIHHPDIRTVDGHRITFIEGAAVFRNIGIYIVNPSQLAIKFDKNFARPCYRTFELD